MNNPAPAIAPAAEDSDFVQFWNDVLAPKFIRFKHILVGGLSRHSDAVFPTLPVRSGDQVLDVGCGFGDTAIRLANQVGATGLVVGVDCCDAFLDQARAEMKSRNVTNLSFVRADAKSAAGDQFVFVFARFGTMFFANRWPACATCAGAARAGAWCISPNANGPTIPGCRWPGRRPEIPPITVWIPDLRSRALSMADEPMVRAMMKAAGFDRIEFRRVDAPVLVGKDVDDAIAFQLAIGPAGEVFREAGALAEAKRAEIEAALAAIDSHKKASDGVVMDSSSWVISAINPP
jgi:SAM-dependent methyltransferase